jgi:hypothetical protein
MSGKPDNMSSFYVGSSYIPGDLRWEEIFFPPKTANSGTLSVLKCDETDSRRAWPRQQRRGRF